MTKQPAQDDPTKAAKAGIDPSVTPGYRPIDGLEVQLVTSADIRHALSAGWADFLRNPLMSGFFGAVYALFGFVFLSGVVLYDQIWMIVAAGVGFPLVAPFLAAGLYEMSRRYEASEPFEWRDILTVIFRQQRREFGWMAFVTLFIFWVWIYQVRLWLAIFLQWQSFSTFDGFVTIVTTTPEGWGFLGVGSIVGALLATWLFSVTVIAMPLLLDREIDFVSAMLISIKTVIKSPIVMLCWGAMIGALVVAALLPVFLGLIIALPVLGHTTWHLYRRAIAIKD